ncbi:MAG: FMN-binding protein [Phycisphaerales bacterium]|nr:MAG: FMN-binding protein [Phycisphaerales bacterium]
MKKFVDESWLVLVMGVVFACLLAGTQTSLEARILENQARALNEAIAEVVPVVDTMETLTVDGNTVYKCLDKEGNLAGWAVDAVGTGFVDKIRLVAGLSPDGSRVTGIKVIEDLETPGLGNKIEGEWADQYKGLDASRKIEAIKGEANRDNNEVQAITGATYSSTYVTDIVNDVIERVRPMLEEHR